MKAVILVMVGLLLSVPCSAKELTYGSQAPDFSLDTLGQEATLTLADYKGKVLYLDFWASWCTACLYSFPALNQLQQEFKDRGFEVLGVNLDEDINDAKVFLAKVPVNFPVAKGFNIEQLHSYDLRALPMGYLIDVQGKILLVNRGFSPKHSMFLRALIDKAVAEVKL